MALYSIIYAHSSFKSLRIIVISLVLKLENYIRQKISKELHCKIHVQLKNFIVYDKYCVFYDKYENYKVS